MMYYIYCITNNINGKTYIGQRKCPANKTSETDKYMGSGCKLKLAKEKHGLENFSKEILAIAETKENINILEKVFIALYRADNKAEYNISAGGDGGIGCGELNPFYGKHHNEKTKKLLSEKCANYGSKNGFYGKTHTEETKQKNRNAHLGKTPSDLARLHMSQSQKGRKHTEETRKKMSESAKGKVFSKEHIENLKKSHKGQIAWNKGIKMNAEQRKNMGRKKGCIPWNKGMKKNLSEVK